MIRGVKKQIIEVQNTENDYFEKAILIVSEKYHDIEKTKLNEIAREYVSLVSPTYSHSREKNKKPLFSPKQKLSAMVAAALIAFLIICLILK